MFITFEGPDGSGKTSVIKEITPWLQQTLDKEILLTREPGGTKIGEEIRELLLRPRDEKMDGWTEALLFIAARRQHLVDVIIPALKANKVVLSDRFMDSTSAYQGAGRGLSVEAIDQIQKVVIGEYLPDLTIYFKISGEEAARRLSDRSESKDRLEAETDEYRSLVEKGYQELISLHPDRFKVIDANGSLPEVVKEVKKVILESLNK